MLGELGKLIIAKGFKKLPKVQKIARSGHTACNQCLLAWLSLSLLKGKQIFTFDDYCLLCNEERERERPSSSRYWIYYMVSSYGQKHSRMTL